MNKGCIKIIVYVVKEGDSLYSISKQYDVNYLKVATENEIPLTQNLVVGQTIVITDAGETKKLGTLEVNGYAYPNINDAALNKTLPYLTYLGIFSYSALPDGSLSDVDDARLIESCKNYEVMPVMVITNIGAEFNFDSDLARTIISSDAITNKLIENIIATMRQKGYYGLDIDFEYIYPSDKELYKSFLQKMSQSLDAEGYFLSAALAPKISATQEGTLYEAHDYAFISQTADKVILMTYEWGYTYSEPMAVAPTPSVRRVLDYAVTEIPPEKILMGIPNYGYIWEIPHKEGNAAQAIGNYQAADIAESNNAAISFDETSQSPNFTYYDSNKQGYEAWFEDARSIEAKLHLASEYNLAGVSYWTINRFFPQNWLVLNSLFEIKKNL